MSRWLNHGAALQTEFCTVITLFTLLILHYVHCLHNLHYLHCLPYLYYLHYLYFLLTLYTFHKLFTLYTFYKLFTKFTLHCMLHCRTEQNISRGIFNGENLQITNKRITRNRNICLHLSKELSIVQVIFLNSNLDPQIYITCIFLKQNI